MFDRRADSLELLDSTGVDDSFAERSYRFMCLVNRFLGGSRVVRRFLTSEAAEIPRGRPLHVLDIGSGSCDIPLAVAHWARRKGLRIRFTCVDHLPQAARIARNKIELAGENNVVFLQEDIFRHQPEEPYDCAIGSMFFHHLTDSEILELIGRLRYYVRGSVLINDLRRSIAHYAGALAVRVTASATLLNDALLSIRRGFRAAELRDLLSSLDGVHVRVANAWLYRVQATIRFNSGGCTG